MAVFAGQDQQGLALAGAHVDRDSGIKHHAEWPGSAVAGKLENTLGKGNRVLVFLVCGLLRLSRFLLAHRGSVVS